MATLGSSYSMRGYYEGRYRDKCAMDAQIELRQHVWRRNGVAVWAGAGTVFPKWLENQEHLFYLFLLILIVPNIILCFTEPMPVVAKVCNVLLPFAFYYLLMTLSRNCGKMFWILFLFIFFGAFQIVLLYLFGQSIIAVDMFLNLVTTKLWSCWIILFRH